MWIFFLVIRYKCYFNGTNKEDYTICIILFFYLKSRLEVFATTKTTYEWKVSINKKYIGMQFFKIVFIYFKK